MLTVQQKCWFWQHHGIGLNVHHAVTLPESAISLQKKSIFLRKGAGESDSLKWGLAEMVLWSVCGMFRFSVFFCCSILWVVEKKGGGKLPTGPPNKFVENTQNTNKKLFLASDYGTNKSLVVYENFIPQKRPSTQLIDATSCVKMCDVNVRCHDWSWRARGHFKLPNVVSRQKVDKLLSNHKAC